MWLILILNFLSFRTSVSVTNTISYVTECPGILEWQQRRELFKCNNTEYHCLLNDKEKHIETCMEPKKVQGGCPWVLIRKSIAYHGTPGTSCSEHINGCPLKGEVFSSHEAYRFPACLVKQNDRHKRNNTKMVQFDDNISRISNSLENGDLGERCLHLLNGLCAFVGFLFGIVCYYVICRCMRSWQKDAANQNKSTPDEQKKLLTDNNQQENSVSVSVQFNVRPGPSMSSQQTDDTKTHDGSDYCSPCNVYRRGSETESLDIYESAEDLSPDISQPDLQSQVSCPESHIVDEQSTSQTNYCNSESADKKLVEDLSATANKEQNEDMKECGESGYCSLNSVRGAGVKFCDKKCDVSSGVESETNKSGEDASSENMQLEVQNSEDRSCDIDTEGRRSVELLQNSNDEVSEPEDMQRHRNMQQGFLTIIDKDQELFVKMAATDIHKGTLDILLALGNVYICMHCIALKFALRHLIQMISSQVMIKRG